jgi:hypothetical protein
MSKSRRLISALILFGLMITMIVPSGPASQASESTSGKVIQVVYDDSGSMIVNNKVYQESWSQAKYALEVFAAMLGPNDELNVFPMSLENKKLITIRGSETAEQRVAKINQMNTNAKGTPYAPVLAAYQDLQAQDASLEKWLVILTDGDFNNVETSQVEADLAKFVNESNIKIIFLAIGDNVRLVKHQPDQNVWVYHAKNGKEILSNVTKIANQIFMRLMLPQQQINYVNGRAEINIDVPMNEVIIFAQGQNIQIGDLSVNQQKAVKKESIEVKVSELIPPNYQNQRDLIQLDRTLGGSVATFVSSQTNLPMPAGLYTLDIANVAPDSIQLYYNLAVDLELLATPLDGQANSGDKLQAGEYQFEVIMVDPITKNPLDSELLTGTSFKAVMTQNGEPVQVTDFPHRQQVEEGTLTVDMTAELPGYNYVTRQWEAQIYPADIPLQISMNAPTEPFLLKTLESAGNYLTVTVEQPNELSNQWEPLSQELWMNTDLTVASPEANRWEITRGDVVSTWHLYPKYAAADWMQTGTGAVPIIVNAQYQVGEQFASGQLQQDVQIEPLTAWESFYEWLKLNWLWLLILLLLLLLILGYIPPFKRYFSGKMKPKVEKASGGVGVPVSSQMKTSFSSILIPYRSVTATIDPNFPAATYFRKLNVKAAKGGFFLLNVRDYAGNEQITFNSRVIKENSYKPMLMTLGSQVMMSQGRNNFLLKFK